MDGERVLGERKSGKTRRRESGLCVARALGCECLRAFVVVQRLHRLDAHAKYVLLKVMRECLELVRSMFSRWYREDLIEFFQGKCFGLGDEEEDEHEANQAGGTSSDTSTVIKWRIYATHFHAAYHPKAP